jgi:hypothetical protein
MKPKELKGLTIALFWFFLLLTFGCGTTSYHRILKPIQSGMENYAILEITDIENFVPQTFSQEWCQRLKERLIAATEEKTQRFDQISDVSGLSIDDSVSNVLVFKLTVIGFELGSGVKRFFVGFGAGKAVLQVKLDMYDKSNGEHIGAAVLTSEAMMAGTNVFRPMAQQFVAFIDRYL